LSLVTHGSILCVFFLFLFLFFLYFCFIFLTLYVTYAGGDSCSPAQNHSWHLWDHEINRGVLRVYYSLAVWRFNSILSAGSRFHSHLSSGLRLRNYRALARNHKFSSRFSVFGLFLWRLFKES